MPSHTCLINTLLNFRWKTRHRRHGRSGKRTSDKPIDFQVRVHVLEARRLAGSGLDPVVKIACGKEMQQTSTQRGTNNPYFDEVSMLNKLCVHVDCDVMETEVNQSSRFMHL